MVKISGRALRLARGDGLTLSSRIGLTAVAHHHSTPGAAGASLGCRRSILVRLLGSSLLPARLRHHLDHFRDRLP